MSYTYENQNPETIQRKVIEITKQRKPLTKDAKDVKIMFVSEVDDELAIQLSYKGTIFSGYLGKR